MPDMTPEEFQEQAVLYELGRLSPERRARFERELEARGPEGRAALEVVRQTLSRAGVGTGAPTITAERAALAAVTSRPLRRQRRARRSGLVLAVVFGALFAAALIWALILAGERSRTEDERAATAASLDSLSAELAARDSLAARGGPTELVPLLVAPDLRSIELTGAGNTSGRLLTSDAGALLVAEGMPPLSGDGAYHLWTRGIRGFTHVTSLGAAPNGFLMAHFSDSAFLEGERTVQLSAENGPPDVIPTGATLLRGTIPPSR